MNLSNKDISPAENGSLEPLNPEQKLIDLKQRFANISRSEISQSEKDQLIFILFKDYYCPELNENNPQNLVNVCPGYNTHPPFLMLSDYNLRKLLDNSQETLPFTFFYQESPRKFLPTRFGSSIIEELPPSEPPKIFFTQKNESVELNLKKYTIKPSHGMCFHCLETIEQPLNSK